MIGHVVLDFETRSEADLGLVGAWNYSLHPSTEIICACWKIVGADGTVEDIGEWDMTFLHRIHPREMPATLRGAIYAGYSVEAHNYSFELAIWENVARARLGWCSIMPSQWRDTMAVACYMAMPAKLDQLARALGMGGKDPEGTRLISRYSKLYLPTSRREIPPEDLRKFIDYCHKDVALEAAVGAYLLDLPAEELEIFRLDREINMRGLLIDCEGIANAAAIVDQRATELVDRFRTITRLNPTQRDKVMAWCAEQGVTLESYAADHLQDLVDGDLPQGAVRDALTIRLQINKASTKKLDAMARHTGPDGRARWQCRYHGAQTGRWTGGGFQPLNLTRGFEDVEPDQLVRDIGYRSPAWLDAIYGDAMDAVSKASRHWIAAAPGFRIFSGDFVSIEAVILACLAGEDWKVEAFRVGAKIYELMGDAIHNLSAGTVTKKTHPAERQDGKIGELAFGYQGGLGAWLNFDKSGRHTDDRINEIKDAWRAKHPATVAFWAGIEAAAIKAMRTGARVEFRALAFEKIDDWLAMILPNGKKIWYREPILKVGMPSWHKPETVAECEAGSCRCQPRTHLSYMAQKEGQWKRVATYGGKLAENAVQGTSREFLKPSMLAARKASYPIILSVYDEIVCEVPEDFGSKEEFEHIMRDAPGFPREWAKGWPIGVDSWIGQRYRK